MKHYLTMILAGWSLAANAGQASDPGNLRLHYDAPAKDWQSECLPIGNGQMGAMLFGQVDQERIQFNEESLWIGNEDDTGAYQNFGEVQMMFENGGPIVTNPSNHVSSGTQTIQESVDGKRETKWCIEHGGRFPIIWQMALTAKSSAVTSYTITSAEDVPERDPKAWRFLGSTDGVAWTVLDEQKDVPLWSDRLSPRSFPVKNQTAYAYYRLEFLETHNVPHFQVAEIALGTADAQEKSGPQNYRRELDLNQAVHRVTYENHGVQFTREAFASFPAKVIAVHVTASKPGALSGTIALTDAHENGYTLVYNTPPVPSTTENFQAEASTDPAELAVRGFFPGYQYDGGKNWLPLHREARLRILHEGGKLTVKDGKLVIEKADSLTLLLAAGTDFLQDRSKNWRGPLPHAAIAARLDAAAKKSYAELRAEHVCDYRRLFDRVELSVGGKSAPSVPTNLRLKQYDMKQPDLGLEELMFQYGRYLLISSSREGGLPANLQGKWNNNNAPAWRCDYHTDVNLEMNYWLADVANLGECFQPFADWIHSIRAVRTEATKKAFGVRGWLLRGESGLFGGSTWNWTPGTSAWFMQNSFDHYAFTRDKEYLRTKAYPAMKEVCEYWLDRLITRPDGTLVTPVGLSPEHGPEEEAVSFDQQLVWDLFTNTIEAAGALGIDPEFRALLVAKKDKLLPPMIGKWGQLQEWEVDRDDPKDDHRHTSHLIAVFPGRQIAINETPELAKAAAVSLDARGVTGDSRTEWAFAWRTALWARLAQGDKAHFMVENLFQFGVFPNLFASYAGSIFQIDGNFGYVAGVCEMLLQSHTGEIELLPALPKAWPNGKVTGLRARGGFTVDIKWKDGKVTNYRIASKDGQSVNVRANGEVKTVKAELLTVTPESQRKDITQPVGK